MFDRFTDRARKIIALAMHEAQRFRHDYIGSEHLLLGLVAEPSGVAVTALGNLHVDLTRARLEIERLVVIGKLRDDQGPLPFTPQAKDLLARASEAAHGLGHPYIGSEHLLLALVADEASVAAQVLVNLGVTLDSVRSEVLGLLCQPADGSEPAMKPTIIVRGSGVIDGVFSLQGVSEPVQATVAGTRDGSSPIEFHFSISRAMLPRMLERTPEGADAQACLRIFDP